MLFELTENSFFCEWRTDELNEGELGSLSEGIVTVQIYCLSRLSLKNERLVLIITWTYRQWIFIKKEVLNFQCCWRFNTDEIWINWKQLFFVSRDELNGGEFGWFSEGILTDENILPRQTQFTKWNIVFYYYFNIQIYEKFWKCFM